MKIYSFRHIAPLLYPGSISRIKNEKTIYLTFDDGPIPEVTEYILDILEEYNAKATFFCVGANVVKNPDIYKRILDSGHTVGNHTHNHLKGTKVSLDEYMGNTEKCAQVVNSNLMRPPYGRITRKQFKALKKAGYHVIYWDVLSWDFLPNLNCEKSLKKICQYTIDGSIVLFHDHLKSYENIKKMLPQYLEYCISRGFEFQPICIG